MNRKRDANLNRSHLLEKVDPITIDNFKTLSLKYMDYKDPQSEISHNQLNNINDSYSKTNTKDKLLKSIESNNKDLLDHNFDQINEENTDFNRLSEAELIEIQKRQLDKLEREANNIKIEEEIRRKEEAQRQKEAQEKADKEKLMKEEILKELPKEPEEDDKEASLIIFRYPHSEQRVQRRFLKTEKIGVLYDFVCTLGTEIFEEEGDFELIFPYPFKIYNDKERTLEEEKLFPNAVLQIREV